MTSLWAAMATDALWRNAWGVIPLAIVVGLVCRILRPRPATQHTLWLIVLVCAVAPPLPRALRFSALNYAIPGETDRSVDATQLRAGEDVGRVRPTLQSSESGGATKTLASEYA